MQIILAQNAGFCMGVRKAMDIALSSVSSAKKPIFTLGPLIHNPSALELLRSHGINIMEDIPEKGNGTVIIRAHGVPPQIKDSLKKAGFEIIDATCTRVIKVQMLVRHYSSKGFHCIVVGDEGHPEVVGIMGYGGEKAILITNENDLSKLSGIENYIVVAQTTQDHEKYHDWSQWILKRFPGGKIFNTICDSTHKRQTEVRELAKDVDIVVVVGGKKSANTRRLAEIVAESGKEALLVEDENELSLDYIKKFDKIGVTAGASTPHWVIEKVLAKLNSSLDI